MPSPHSSTLHCFLPGLCWPGQGFAADLAQHPLPALAWLFARARVQRGASERWLPWLSDRLGASAPLPWGSLRRAGEADAVVEDGWLCADPVSLQMSRDALLLHGPDALALSEAESTALIASLNAECAHAGEFLAASPGRWYLRADAEGVSFSPLPDVIGRPAQLFPCQGAQARQWNRLANEIQILLHNHPVNQARVARGHLPANGVWLWGEGRLPPVGSLQLPTALASQDLILRGLARAGKIPCADSPAALQGSGWWVDSRLQAAASTGDFPHWHAALRDIDQQLQTLLAAWQRGQIRQLEIHAPGDRHSLHLRLARPARWAFWRKPLPSAALATWLQSPTS